MEAFQPWFLSVTSFATKMRSSVEVLNFVVGFVHYLSFFWLICFWKKMPKTKLVLALLFTVKVVINEAGDEVKYLDAESKGATALQEW